MRPLWLPHIFDILHSRGPYYQVSNSYNHSSAAATGFHVGYILLYKLIYLLKTPHIVTPLFLDGNDHALV
ncbi:hypothetical protein BGS_0354 [Beggiatoa sp. SS]|nr:hypothetical protein BGS_0354 [Beggiatoa sp. SS]